MYPDGTGDWAHELFEFTPYMGDSELFGGFAKYAWELWHRN